MHNELHSQKNAEGEVMASDYPAGCCPPRTNLFFFVRACLCDRQLRMFRIIQKITLRRFHNSRVHVVRRTKRRFVFILVVFFAHVRHFLVIKNKPDRVVKRVPCYLKA